MSNILDLHLRLVDLKIFQHPGSRETYYAHPYIIEPPHGKTKNVLKRDP